MQFKLALLLTLSFAILELASCMLYCKNQSGQELRVPSFSRMLELSFWLERNRFNVGDIIFREATASEMRLFPLAELGKLTRRQKTELLSLQWNAEDEWTSNMQETLMESSEDESELSPPENSDVFDEFDPYGFFPGHSDDEAPGNDDGGSDDGGGGNEDDNNSEGEGKPVHLRLSNLGLQEPCVLPIPSKSPTPEFTDHSINFSPPGRKSRCAPLSFEQNVVSGQHNLLRASSDLQAKKTAEYSLLWKFSSTNHCSTQRPPKPSTSLSPKTVAGWATKTDPNAD